MNNLALKLTVMTMAVVTDTVNKAKDERGQGTIEYLGAIIVAVVIVLATIDAVGNLGIGEAIKDQVKKVTDKSG